MWREAAFLTSLFATWFFFHWAGSARYKTKYEEELNAKEEALRELRLVDEALARRPALKDYATRYSKIEFACYFAAKYEDTLMTKKSEEHTA